MDQLTVHTIKATNSTHRLAHRRTRYITQDRPHHSNNMRRPGSLSRPSRNWCPIQAPTSLNLPAQGAAISHPRHRNDGVRRRPQHGTTPPTTWHNPGQWDTCNLRSVHLLKIGRFPAPSKASSQGSGTQEAGPQRFKLPEECRLLEDRHKGPCMWKPCLISARTTC